MREISVLTGFVSILDEGIGSDFSGTETAVGVEGESVLTGAGSNLTRVGSDLTGTGVGSTLTGTGTG